MPMPVRPATPCPNRRMSRSRSPAEGRPYRYGLPGHNAHWLEERAYPLIRMGPQKSEAEAGLPPN